MYINSNWLWLSEQDASIILLGGRWFYLKDGDSAILRIKNWIYLREGNQWIIRLFKRIIITSDWSIRYSHS